MNIVWQNLRKRGQSKLALGALSRIVSGADLILLQETCAREASPLPQLAHTIAFHASRDLSGFAAIPIVEQISIVVDEPFALGVKLGDNLIFNVHLSAYRSTSRMRELDSLIDIVDKLSYSGLAIGGDFNFAPSLADGLYNGEPSRWTVEGERHRLGILMHRNELFDALGELGEQEFSIERRLKKNLIQFRCDFILCSKSWRDSARASYIHEARIGSWAFTDHSGMRLIV